jgi:alpha-ketoglutarate-dependent taurine dioxygenase
MAFHTTSAANNRAGDYSHISVRPMAGSMGAEISGIGGALDVRSLDDDEMAEIRRANDDHLVVFFRDQELTPAELETFTARWGEFGDDPYLKGMDEHPHVVRVRKEADEKVPLVFGGAWHSDWSFQTTPPAYTILFGVDVPDHGGDTLWANMYLATEYASETFRSLLRSLDAVHSPAMGYGPGATHNELIENMDIEYGERGTETHRHPMIRRHPRTGRETLFVNPVYTVGINGMREEEAQAILGQIHEVATNPVHLCRFRWEPGSMAVWDNRCTMHLPLGDYHGARREMWRTTVKGEVPVRAD